MRGRIVHYLVEKSCGSLVMHLPEDFNAAQNVLFIMPEDPLDSLNQIENFVSLIGFFRDTRITIVCEKNVSAYFKNFSRIAVLFEYEKKNRYLFSKEMSSLQKKLSKEYIDLCICLERSPDISLLKIMGSIHAKVRMGYFCAGEYPFFNYRVKSTSQTDFTKDQNQIMATLLGANLKGNIRWSISKDALEEVSHRLKEFSLPPEADLVGIDAFYLYSTFGEQMNQLLDATTKAFPERKWLLITSEIFDLHFLQWLQKLRIPVFNDHSASRIAAVLYKVSVFISGKSPLYAMANLLAKPTIGLFEKNDFNRYFKESPRMFGIVYTAKSVKEIVDEICKDMSSIAETSVHSLKQSNKNDYLL
jgi:ADP-heptose:LPS heptosyltransferase